MDATLLVGRNVVGSTGLHSAPLNNLVSVGLVSAYSLTISVPTGDPSELQIVEVSNWIGRALSVSRVPSKAAIEHGLQNAGIYLLIGDSAAGEGEESIYIGESENVFERLRNHQNKPTLDFWTQTVCFTAANNFMNKGHLRFMESELLKLANNAKTWHVVNSQAPTTTPLGTADQIAANAYLTTALNIATVLKVSAFKQPQLIGGDRLTLRGPAAQAEGEHQPGGFVVLAGSLARRDETPSLSKPISEMRKRLIKEGRLVPEGQSLRLSNNHEFSSPSAAASVFLGRSANGLLEWKSADGMTLKQIQDSQLN